MTLSKSIIRFLSRADVEIFLLFVAWRSWLFVFALLGLVALPAYSRDFFGGGFENYFVNPLFWAWANFDGEHYSSLVQHGYQSLTHAFFPFYPLVVRLFAAEGLVNITVVGLVISNLSLLVSLVLLWHLVRIDFPPRVALFAVIGLLCFPTSFYFGAFYTESLFFLLVVGSFLAARKNRWFIAGSLGAAASATRVFGILLFPALLVEWWQQASEKGETKVGNGFAPVWLLLAPLGFLAYVAFLYQTTGNPLTFYSELAPFGEQRGSGQIVILPQVFWRYIKMIFSVNIFTPLYLTIVIEFLTAVSSLFLIFWLFLKKVRFSYAAFVALGYILPTLTGSFSSLPRYLLVLFPLYIFLGNLLSRSGRLVKFLLLVISLSLLAVETMLFVRGYWVG